MSNYLIVLLYSAGIVQTLILGAVIVKKRKLGKAPDRILLGLLLTILLVLVQYTLILTGNWRANRLMGELGTASWFALGPLFYLYTLSRKPGFALHTWHLLLFLIPLYNLLQYTVSLFYPGLGFFLLFNNAVVYSYAWLMAYMAHTLLFVLFSVISIRKSTTNDHKSLLRFLQLWLAVLILLSIYLLLKANSLTYFYQLERYLVIIFNIFVHILTFRSLLASRAFDTEKTEPKYSNSGLSREELARLYEKLESTMKQEKPYMDRKLNLTGLARVSEIRENQLSQVFSQYLNSSFYDFVSQYRLREVEERLKDPKYAHLKIISLAEDCGFNSKAAFYKTFREKHAQTPTQYLKSLKP